MDPLWLSTILSALAALLAAIAAFRPRTDAAAALVTDALDDLRTDLTSLRGALADEMRLGRGESGTQARDLRGEVQVTLDRLGTSLRDVLEKAGHGTGEKVEAVAAIVRALSEANERRLTELRRESEEGGKALREGIAVQVGAFGDLLGRQLHASAAQQKERLDDVAGTIRRLTQTNAEAHEGLKAAVEGRLETLRQENASKLEEMRRTVDEKLQGTLEERLGEKFKMVSHHLEQVHRSVGEMQSLATGVGDLKRVLTNVKSRGTWAEVSLGSLLEQTLTADQFARNVETVPGSNARVEYAVRLPGQSDDRPFWLPIDAKFPIEDYERLLDASERADVAAIDAALKALETQIKLEGAKICAKYVSPPDTTDFAVMYLPTEGLYAEVLRRPGLVDHLQSRCKIMVAGPTNLHAFLNTLRLGFRTLAVEKRSSEVWKTLGEVKTEFGKYGDVLDAVKKKLHEASRQIDNVAVRKRSIDRKLRGVEGLAEAGEADLLPLEKLIAAGDDLLDAAE